jgi:DNA mismatch repair protein MutL
MDEHLATLIAAGEVVAGPVSVVKELVDNALDAGATSVDIAVEEGGLRTIRVADNGCGMDETDAVLCLSRHATSKIATVEDLSSIHTLGFRGEALAAIVAVSHLKIETQREDDAVGTAVRAAGGAVIDQVPISRRPGTTIEVGHLFYNTPARREFQDSARAETTRIVVAAERLAISRPDVRFTLRAGGREVLNLPGSTEWMERVCEVHGDDFADALIPIRGTRGDVTVTGFVTRPSAAVRRPRRNTFIVNGRPFESFEIRRLLTSTFAGMVPYGYHVEAIVRIDLPVDDVDVNVSPDKSQVRFRRAGQVLAAVSDALRHALGEREATRTMGRPGESAGGAADTDPAAERHLAPDVAARLAALKRYEAEQTGQPDAWEQMFGAYRDPRQHAPPPAGVAEPGAAFAPPGPGHAPPSAEPSQSYPPSPATAAAAPRHGIPLDPSTILQVGNAFLVCATDDGLLIVDQHSAHERVNYERFRARFEAHGRDRDVQPLIFPEVLRLDAGGIALIEEMQPFLERLGFEISPAGPREVLVQGVPAALGERSAGQAIEALMSVYAEARSRGIASAEAGEGMTPMEDRLLQTMACHAAVKAGQPLSGAEIRTLWKDLVRVDLACHDVHGRPGVLLLPTAEIARRMGR